MGRNNYSGSNKNDVKDIYSGRSRDVYSKSEPTKKRDVKRIVLNIVFSVVLFLSIAVFCVISFFDGYVFSGDSFKGNDPNDYIDLTYSSHEDVTYFLVAGLDYSEALTDVLMVVCYDHGKNEVNCLQIPRDTFAGSDVVKINSVYGYNGKGIKGINALRRRITSLFGLPIDHFVAINLEAFRKIVDAVGGVTITIDRDMYVEASTNPNNPWGTERFLLKKGTQTLTGKQAEGFVRNRSYYATGDPGRMTAQRKFYSAFMKEVLGMSTSEAVTIAQQCYSDIDTDMTVSQLLGYFAEIKDLKLENINITAVPGQSGCYYGSQDCYSVLINDYVELANKYMLPYDDPIKASDLKLVDISSSNGGNWMPGIGSLGDYSADGS